MYELLEYIEFSGRWISVGFCGTELVARQEREYLTHKTGHKYRIVKEGHEIY